MGHMRDGQLHDGIRLRARAQAVALGLEPPDLLVHDCDVLNVHSGALLRQHHVGTAGPYIAFVSPEEAPAGPNTLVLDGRGKCLVPGFIDAHTHLDEGVLTVPESLRYAAAGGTTVFVTNALEVGNNMGVAGVTWFLDSCRRQPVHIFTLAPTMVLGHSGLVIGHTLGFQEISDLLQLPEVIGLGESYWTQVISDRERLLPLFALASSMDKIAEGHCAGAPGPHLNAMATVGVTACHEAITVADVEKRLAAGIFTMIREGSIRRELPALAPLAGRDMDHRYLGLCTDGIDPPELLQLGYMEYVVQRAIDLGFAPVTAIQMATINNATYYHLDRHLGGITPGRYADFCLLPDLRTIKAEVVVSKGVVIARNGRLVVRPHPYAYPAAAREMLDFSRRFSPAELRLQPPPGRRTVTARVIDQRNDMVTAGKTLELEVQDSELQLPPGVNKAVAISTIDPGVFSAGLISGWCLRTGACASSATWDGPHITAVGATDQELALAVNRVAELGGGVVVCQGNEIIVELPLPIGGIISDLPAEEVASRMEKATAALLQMGYPYRNPLTSLRVLNFVGVPRLRLSAKGLIAVSSQGAELVDLFL